MKIDIESVKSKCESWCKGEIAERSVLGQELEYRLDLQAEAEDYTAPDYCLALFDIEDWAIKDKKTTHLLHVIYIGCGLVREITDEELARTTVSGGRGKSSLYFTMNGKKWTQDEPNCHFVN